MHEHPIAATSWREASVQKVWKLEGVGSVITDQCMFGLNTTGPQGQKMLAKKQTIFLSNAEEILKGLGRKCDGQHQHQQLMSGRAGPAVVCPPALCKCRGLMKQLQLKDWIVKSLLSVDAHMQKPDAPAQEEDEVHKKTMYQAWSDVSEKSLDPQWG